ncbi:MAG: alkaline phosphatase family protein [Puniceicoccaceae bacterium]|nr:MAG: alkaline phosphatase family protein [Puniceicoccaceae bacterium]
MRRHIRPTGIAGFRWLLLWGVLAALLCLARGEGKPTVFLISLDGIRPDYLERAETPFFDHLMETGAYSLELAPAFPTVTFSSHVNFATGVKAAQHGITLNTFYDTRTRERYRYAGDQALLEAEPIWTTATRQGVRTLVKDWVNAHNQTGPHATAYFGPHYTRGISDRERVERILRTWEEDEHGEPLRFILAYTESPDTEGHRYGPDAPETTAALAELDGFMAEVYERALALWRRTAGPEDVFYFVIVSDHGMAPVRYHVDPSRTIAIDPRITVTASSALTHYFFDQIADREEAMGLMQELREKLEAIEPITVHARDELPTAWDYAHPYRTGDLVALVPVPYAFFRHQGPGPIQPSEQTGRFFGAHGYDVRTEPTMMTVLMAQRHPEPLGSGNLGRIHGSQLHPTIARLLEIEPAETATAEPVRLAQ